MRKLTAVAVRVAKHDPAKGQRPVRIGDGAGLYLQIATGNTKSWLLRFTLRAKAREMGLGPAGEEKGEVSLAEARKRAGAARALLERGIDPIEERDRRGREEAEARKAQVASECRSFRAVTKLCIEAGRPGWKNKRTALLWRSSLEKYVHPALGDRLVADIDRFMVLEAVTPVWTSAPSIGKKVLHRIGAVLRYATAHGWRTADNPAEIKLLRAMGLPPTRGGRKQPSLPWPKVPGFMQALSTAPGSSALALRLQVLTALRPGEARQARWAWVSFDGTPTLTIPGEVMKGRQSADVQPHRVPLSPAAVEVLALAFTFATGISAESGEIPRFAALRADTLIFPSTKRNTPLSDMAVSEVLRGMNADRPDGAPPPWRDASGREAVPHGFRGSFRTWVDDTRPEEDVAAEKALAHEVGTGVSARYRHSDLFDRRIPLMNEWAAHCASAAANHSSDLRRAVV